MKLIILDRDGVINYDSPYYIKSPDEWIEIPGSLAAIAKLNRAGYTVAVASNQSGVSRGYYTEATLGEIHDKMRRELAKYGGMIDKIVYCTHLPSDACECRKPKTGMLKQIASYYDCNLKDIPFIGDRVSDIQAALAVEARPIILGMNDEQMTELEQQFHIAIPHFANLAEAVENIIAQDRV